MNSELALRFVPIVDTSAVSVRCEDEELDRLTWGTEDDRLVIRVEEARLILLPKLSADFQSEYRVVPIVPNRINPEKIPLLVLRRLWINAALGHRRLHMAPDEISRSGWAY